MLVNLIVCHSCIFQHKWERPQGKVQQAETVHRQIQPTVRTFSQNFEGVASEQAALPPHTCSQALIFSSQSATLHFGPSFLSQ